jgi:hypothetical protein
VAQRADWPVCWVDLGGCVAHFPIVKIAFYLRLEIFRSFYFSYLTSILIPDLRLEISALACSNRNNCLSHTCSNRQSSGLRVFDQGRVCY